MAEESGGRMDGVMVVLGNRGMPVEAACTSMRERSESPGTYVTE